MHTDPPVTAAKCKHACKNKETCGHACCKRHLPLATQLKLSQRLVGVSAPTPSECKHTCRDKRACGHQCCKRHFSRDLTADPQEAQPPANLQITAQAGRKALHSTDKHVPRQLACAALLQVQGKSVLQSKKALPESSPDANAKYHFFVYDIESTGERPHKIRPSPWLKLPACQAVTPDVSDSSPSGDKLMFHISEQPTQRDG